MKLKCKFLCLTFGAGGLWLPEEKYCPLHFLQCILQDDKGVFEAGEVALNERVHDTLPEYAIKHVWPQVRHSEQLRHYLPTEELELERYPDRRFFYGVL